LRCQHDAHRHYCRHTSGKLLLLPPLPLCCRRTAAALPATVLLPMTRRCHQAAKLAAITMLPPPRCCRYWRHRAITAALLPH
jgi:hypothetical protein